MTTEAQPQQATEAVQPRLALHRAAVESTPTAAPGHQDMPAHYASLITLVVGLLLGGLLIVFGQSAVMPSTRTSSAPLLDVTSAPTIAPSATTEPTPPAAAQPALPVGLAVYFAPDGDAAPSLPSSTSNYTPTARYEGWVQMEIEGYAVPVWARSDAVQGIDLAGLPEPYEATPTPGPVVIVRQAPAAPVVLDCTPDRVRYRVSLAVGNLGTVEGVSCTSQAQAQANAEMLAEQLRTRAKR